MLDEIDQVAIPAARSLQRVPRAPVASPRLVARLFAAAGASLRVRFLRCLMRPLGPLGTAGVAAGTFAAFMHLNGNSEPHVDAEAVARLSSQQVHELAHFVEQVDPRALQLFASIAADSALARSAFSASVLVMLERRLQPGATRG